MFKRALFAATTAIALAAQPAAAITFSFTTISGDSLTAAQGAAFQAAANAWSAVLTDPVVVNVQIGFKSLGSGVLGATSASLGTAVANQAKAALIADASSSDDRTAVASLPSFGPTDRLQLTTAQARAIGFTTGSGSDGSIEFSSDYNFSTSRNADGSIASGTYDLIGIAEHEIAHLLGFQSSIDNGGSPTILDEFRYTAAGSRATAAGAAYFSIDGGTTNLAAFSTGKSGEYQASHWSATTMSGGVNALMDPAVATGVVQNITALDLRALDVIGYDVPEPASLAVLAMGLMGAGLGRRRRAA